MALAVKLLDPPLHAIGVLFNVNTTADGSDIVTIALLVQLLASVACKV